MKIFDNKIFGLELKMYKLFWPIALVGIVFFLSLKVFILPKIDEISDLNKKVSRMKNEVVGLEEKLLYLEGLDEDSLNKRLLLLDIALPKKKDVYFLVNVIDSIAKKYRFSTDSFSVSPGELNSDENVVSGPKLANIPVDVVLYGPEDKYLDFLKGIEESLPVLVINQFEMTTTNNVVKIELSVSTFFVNEGGNDIDSLALKDFKLSKEEEELFTELNSFEGLELFLNRESWQSEEEQYVRYEKRDPFRP
ncbi:hypothetical protein KJ642_00605 [Patescibacteria group bacterium]|nr:hypothetical protein [Patescibacteria group bacterium]MBU4389775.1 hypothetical protein [Patescibacteria group bacterium]MBU4578466.1 hypothetical protein [Patescibacteria group bacterium]MCG2701613.1 hypothetical protein [Candidatus Parcubacteria bacterium]